MPIVPLSVLVVEDDLATRDAIVRIVRELGYSCRGASDGAEGWESHRAERADVILGDWQMPRMDGIELLRRVRADDDGHYTYFILMSSFADRAHFVEGMEAGADDYQPKPIEIDELGARLVSAGRVIALHRRLSAKADRLRRDSQRSFQIARIDPLTRVGNRLAMEEELRTFWGQVKRYAYRAAVAIADVDHFKAYNDRFGHVEGDKVLLQVAQTIRTSLREGDAVYRYGGEEFVIVLPEQSIDDAGLVLERVRRAIEAQALANGEGGVVTVSFGAAVVDPSRDERPEDCIRRADAALYRAKQAGRNRVELDR